MVVQGFVRNMSEWMAASDCVVTKAGPGTIIEACIVGRPIMLSDFIEGQETGNVTYVVENGIGACTREPEEIGRIVRDWLTPGNAGLAAMSLRAVAGPACHHRHHQCPAQPGESAHTPRHETDAGLCPRSALCA